MIYTNLQDLLKRIKANFIGQLPGTSAQLKMAPEGRDIFINQELNPKDSAVLILFYSDNGELKFPLIRRPAYDGHHSGQMAFPGGKRDHTDVNIIATAIRETCEEIGICHSFIDVLGCLSPLHIPISNMVVTPVVAFTEVQPQFIRCEKEVEEIFTVSIKELLNPDSKKSELWNYREKDWMVPFYLLQGQKVWGATAMILSELEELIKQGAEQS